MDEPTSGLSSSDSEMVMKSCKLIAQYFGTTIITVIHQPRATLFNLFDHVMLMCEGRVAYNGPRADLERYFAGLGFRCPPSDNPADYYLDIITPGVEGAEPERILDAWAANKNAEVSAQCPRRCLCVCRRALPQPLLQRMPQPWAPCLAGPHPPLVQPRAVLEDSQRWFSLHQGPPPGTALLTVGHLSTAVGYPPYVELGLGRQQFFFFCVE